MLGARGFVGISADYSIKDSLYTFLMPLLNSILKFKSGIRLGSGLSIIAMEFSEFTSLFDLAFARKLLFAAEARNRRLLYR